MTLAARRPEQVSCHQFHFSSHYINSSSIGYSGEDCPRSMIPSLLGVLEGEAARQPRRPINTDDAEMVDEAAEAPKIRYISGRTEIGRKRDHMSIKPLFQEDGMSKY